MFTGIVEEVGRVRANAPHGGGRALRIDAEATLDGTRVGDSISVNGCCITVSALRGDGFDADLMTETVRVTTLGQLEPGAAVNLERALTFGARLGGHLLQGHVDAVGRVVAVDDSPGALVLTIDAPDAVARYLVRKGSVAIDGVSLTVVDVEDHAFTVSIIPHTRAVTTLGAMSVGSAVNLEADIIAKHVERLLARGIDTPYGEHGVLERRALEIGSP